MKSSDFTFIPMPTTEHGWVSKAPEIVNEEKTVAIAGTVVVCPKCKDRIGRLSVPIFSGMQIPADAIEFERHQVRHSKEKAQCRKCGEPYMKHFFTPRLQTRIHTELGWI